MDKDPVDDGDSGRMIPDSALRVASDEECHMIAEGMAHAFASAADACCEASGLVRAQALGCVVSAFLTVTDRVCTFMLTIPKDQKDRVAALAEVAKTRQQMLMGVQILYQSIEVAGDTPSVLVPKVTLH